MPRIKRIVRLSRKDRVKCIRCSKFFPNVNSLKVHNRTHLQKMEEMNLLEQGKTPSESKIGSSFRGKNRVIIA